MTRPLGQGMGLGLSVSHGIITRHTGTHRGRQRARTGKLFPRFLPIGPVVPEPHFSPGGYAQAATQAASEIENESTTENLLFLPDFFMRIPVRSIGMETVHFIEAFVTLSFKGSTS